MRAKFSILTRWAALALGAAAIGVPALAAQQSGAVTGFVTVKHETDARAMNTVVWIEGVPRESVPAPLLERGGHPSMVQKNLRFIPEVLPVMVGATVDFPNKDNVFHNVYSVSAAHRFDLGLYPQGTSRSTTFDKSGIVEIGCNTHPQMKAWIVVVPGPYFAMPNERGVYQIKDIPSGNYTIKVWNPDFGLTSEPVTLERAGQVVNLDFDLGEESGRLGGVTPADAPNDLVFPSKFTIGF
jgi:hypothetical protein